MACDSKAGFVAYVEDTDAEICEYEKGDVHFVTEPDQARPVKVARTGVASLKPETLIDTFVNACKRWPDRLAIRREYMKGEEYVWREWTHQQYYDEAMRVAKALIAAGLECHECVNILGFNCPHWFFADIGAVLAGGIAAGIYTTNSPAACKYISEHSKAKVVFVENAKQLEKYADIMAELEHLKYVVVWDEVDSEPVKEMLENEQVITYDEFLSLGEALEDSAVEERWAKIDPGHACTLIYTSGTTGQPKAVMASHDNMVWTARASIESTASPEYRLGGQPEREERCVSYLPLSHIAAQMLDVVMPLCVSAYEQNYCSLTFARKDALKGTIAVTLNATQPTVFFGVPRVWEKIQEKMLARSAEGSSLKRNIAKWAKGRGLAYAEQQQATGDGSVPWGHTLASMLVFKKVRGLLGLTNCKICCAGAAPLRKETQEFFASLSIMIQSMYGMSECTGPATMNRPHYFMMGSNGPKLSGCEVKLFRDEKRDEEGQGEICMRGRHIMLGYMYNPEKTAESIDEEGWLHSGDVGAWEHECLYITGRIKELIIGAGGENIAPVPIEHHIKELLPGVSNFVMVGDKRKYNVALVTLKTQGTPQEGFSDKLVGPAASVDPSAVTVGQAQDSKVWKDYIQAGLDKYNADKHVCVSSAQTIQYFFILNEDFSMPQDTIGPTLKLKRSVVNKMFAEAIDNMYEGKTK